MNSDRPVAPADVFSERAVAGTVAPFFEQLNAWHSNIASLRTVRAQGGEVEAECKALLVHISERQKAFAQLVRELPHNPQIGAVDRSFTRLLAALDELGAAVNH